MKTIEEKFKYLKKILDIYIIFSRRYNKVEIYQNNDLITIKYTDPKRSWYKFEEIEFPIIDLDKRIEHYKNKIRYNFNKRKTHV